MNKKLFEFCEAGDLDSLSKAIKKNSIDVNSVRDELGNSLLHISAKNSNLKVSKYLIENGIDTDLKNKNLDTCFHLSILSKNPELVDLFIEQFCDIDATDKQGKTGLIIAVGLFRKNKDVEKVIEIVKLLIDKVCLETTDDNKRNALHYAVLRESKEIVKMLTHKNQLIETKDISGKTPIDYAVEKNNEEMFCLLKKSNSKSAKALFEAMKKKIEEAKKLKSVIEKDITKEKEEHDKSMEKYQKRKMNKELHRQRIREMKNRSNSQSSSEGDENKKEKEESSLEKYEERKKNKEIYRQKIREMKNKESKLEEAIKKEKEDHDTSMKEYEKRKENKELHRQRIRDRIKKEKSETKPKSLPVSNVVKRNSENDLFNEISSFLEKEVSDILKELEKPSEIEKKYQKMDEKISREYKREKKNILVKHLEKENKELKQQLKNNL